MDDVTSLIFMMSAGGRDNRMCSKTSGGSSDTDMLRIIGSRCVVVWVDPRFALVTGNYRTETPHRSQSDRQHSLHHHFLCPTTKSHNLPCSKQRSLSRSSRLTSRFSSTAQTQFSGCRRFLVAPLVTRGTRKNENLQIHTHKFMFGAVRLEPYRPRQAPVNEIDFSRFRRRP